MNAKPDAATRCPAKGIVPAFLAGRPARAKRGTVRAGFGPRPTPLVRAKTQVCSSDYPPAGFGADNPPNRTNGCPACRHNAGPALFFRTDEVPTAKLSAFCRILPL